MTEPKLDKDGVVLASIGMSALILLAIIDLYQRYSGSLDIPAEYEKLKELFSAKTSNPDNIYARPNVPRQDMFLNKGGQGIPNDILSYLRRRCGYSDEQISNWWSLQEADSKLEIPSNCN